MDTGEKASVTLRLPSTLSAFSGGKSQIVLQANTVGELLQVLKEQQPSVWQQLCTEEGSLREHVNIFLNNIVISGSIDPDDMDMDLFSGQEIIVLTMNSHS